MAVSLGPILILFVLILMIAMVAVIVVISAVARRKRVSAPSCGSCGYAVEGLESLRCPECGSDLRQVGILTSRQAGSVPRPVWAVLYTILLPVPALILTAILAAALPVNYASTTTLTLMSPPSRAYNSVVIVGDGRRRQGIDRADRVNLRLIRNDGSAAPDLEYDTATDSLTIKGADGPQPLGALSAESIKEWMAATGLDADNPRLDAEAIELARTVRMLNSGGATFSSGPFGGMSSSTSGGPVPRTWFPITMWAFWLLIWIGGLFLILFRRRQQIDAAPA